MKTIRLFLLIGVFASNYSFAQKQWQISPRLGLNMVPIEENDASGTTYKIGPAIGIMVGTNIGNNWDIEFGLTFNRRFSHYYYAFESDAFNLLNEIVPDLLNEIVPDSLINLLGDDLLNTYEKVNGYTDYWTIDLPIILDYRFESGFHFFAGPYINYMFFLENNEEKTTHIPLLELTDLSGSGIDENLLQLLPKNGTEQTFNSSKDNINEVDFGFMGGFGYKGEKWILRFTYQYGLEDIRTDNTYVGINNQRAINLSIGYLILPNNKSSKMKPRYDLDLIK